MGYAVQAITTRPTTFTPSWTSSGTQPSLGNGTIIGEERIIGDLVYLSINLTMGSTTTYGTGTYSFGLNTPAATMATIVAGGARCNAGGTTFYSGITSIGSNSTTVIVAGPSTANVWGQTIPGTWASGNFMILTVIYPRA